MVSYLVLCVCFLLGLLVYVGLSSSVEAELLNLI